MSQLSQSELLDGSQLLQARVDTREGVETFRSALFQGNSTLEEYHLEGGDPEIVGRQRSWLIDRILLYAWPQFIQRSFQSEPPLLIATGGYGRAELNIASDIDLLILLPDRSPEQLKTTERFIQFCWDAGLKVGHSARTIQDCVTLSLQNLSVATSLMEIRLLHGSQQLFNQLHMRLRKSDIWPADRYFEAKLQEQQSRHLHFSETQYNLEPNLKESPGGLRDLHMISWVANRYFGTSDFAELVGHRFLTKQEYLTLIRSRNFLWRLRNGLHILAGRCEDRLLFDYQRELARQFNFRGDSNHKAVEKLMKSYYRTAKEIQLLNEIALQHFEEVLLTHSPTQKQVINERFNAIGNYIEIADEGLFQRCPETLLEIFYIIQQQPNLAGVRAATIRQIRSHISLINAEFRKDPKNRKIFLDMFKHQDGLTHCLRRMNTYGVLGKFFPDFGKIVGQMQHDLFHIFTVDTHSLFVVRNLRRFMVDAHRHEFPVLSTIMNKLNQRERLFLAALCHDIGKGSGRDHSEVGEKIALSLCRRLGMNDYDARFVSWLVRNHLIMSFTAQREDASDPRVIDRFAERVGDQEHLDNLYLLTVADIRGTSHSLWNEWTGSLLSNLYTATSRRIRAGIAGTLAISQRIADRKQAIRKLLQDTVSRNSLDGLWKQLDQEYFLRNSPMTCAWHATEICNAAPSDLPLVSTRYRSEINAEQILIVTPDTEDLLVRATGAIDNLRLDILDARIHRTLSDLGILIFIAACARVELVSSSVFDYHKVKIKNFLMKPHDNYQPVSVSLPRALKQFKVPTTVTFSDNEEFRHTTMEVTSQDRPSLLLNVSRALLESKVRLLSAKVSTLGEKAEDTFFITDRDGHPISGQMERVRLESRIKVLLD